MELPELTIREANDENSTVNSGVILPDPAVPSVRSPEFCQSLQLAVDRDPEAQQRVSTALRRLLWLPRRSRR